MDVELLASIVEPCQDEITPQHDIFLKYFCDTSIVNLRYFGPMERDRLANIVMVCDLVIMLVFAINLIILQRYIPMERHLIDQGTVMMTDFTVRVKNLPPLSEYETLDQLKAQLTMHINKVVAKQSSVYGE